MPLKGKRAANPRAEYPLLINQKRRAVKGASKIVDFALRGYRVDTISTGSVNAPANSNIENSKEFQISDEVREEVIDFWMTLNSYKLELVREGKWKKC